MRKSIMGRFAAVIIIAVLSALYFLPTLPDRMLPEGMRDSLPGEGLNLGLDLMGGIHLVLRVEREVAVVSFVERLGDNVANGLEKLLERPMEVSADGEYGLVIANPGGADDLSLIREHIADRFREIEESTTDDAGMHLVLKPEEADRIRIGAVTQSLETIRNRIDQFGVAEPLIQQQGADEILVQLPGVSDPERAIALIGKTAVLEFKMVDEDVTYTSGDPIPDGDELLYRRVTDPVSGLEIDREPYVLNKKAILTGSTLTDARVAFDQFNDPYVAITFDSVGAEIFGRVTTDNVGRRFAVVLDNNVYTAPVIREPIMGGRASISGNFTSATANDLAIVLRAGALPAPVTILQNVTVGPSLGADSIRAGLTATLSGLVLVMIFMTFYYRVAGLIANFALVLNLTILMGALGTMHATLTLPGIAGILLTIGMGVDSNVLIFERIREELKLGKTVRLAVDQGYDRALVTIVDAHVTTLITALVLFLFGSGPVKGFAVTLSLGILINFFTAFVGTKVFFDWMNSRKRLAELSI
ncbi:MAG: protein translocase subunit SecD [Leptospirillia bacterium]